MDTQRWGAGFDARDDEPITRDVRRELREDVLTSDLWIEVETRHGVVRLRGEVPTIEDAENAEAVANRISGVKEVQDNLVVRSLR
jgi:osmotically-inducible protein OsmY